MKNEKGQALLLALIGLAVGTLIVLPLMRKTSVFSIAARSYPISQMGEAASNAGVEDAIWRLTHGDLASQLASPGQSVGYSLDQPINGMTPQITVIRDHIGIASDGFESGDWLGGSGWLAGWYHEGEATLASAGNSYEGSYSLLLQGDTDYVKRSVDLSNLDNLRLQFWARARSFQSDEQAQCLVSPNGTDWTVVETWADGDDDNVYRFHDIDLSPFAATSEFWIAFQTNLPGSNSYLYIDSIVILRQFLGTTLEPPSDDFESGDWAGGAHWLGPWFHEGEAKVTTAKSPYQGQFHMELTGPGAYVERSTDLSNYGTAKLTLWGKGSQLEVGDHTDCLVTADGIDWYSIFSWTIDDGNREYHPVEVDLPPMVLTDGFRLAFLAVMTSTSDFFDADVLQIEGRSRAYQIVSTAGGVTITAEISIEDGAVTVHSWLTEA